MQKMRKITLLTTLIICFAGTANAQFLKKLGKKITKAAERTVERKAEQKTAKETGEVFDSTFNTERKSKAGNAMPGLSKVEPAESYAFNHKVEMQIKNGKEVMDADYFLRDSGNFFAVKIKDKKRKDDIFTVFDIDKEAMFTYMENDGQKVKMGIEFKLDDTTDDTTNEPSVEITATGNTKIILGYNCQEYKMKGEDMTGTIWVTKEVDIRFPNNFHSVKQNKSTNQEWMKELDGWAMETKIIDTSKRKPQTIIMNCLSIESSSLKIDSNDYQNIGGR